MTAIDRRAKQDVVYQLLGGNPVDLLLPSNFIIVEGPSDQILLNHIIRRFYSDKPQIQIVTAEGDDKRQRQNMEAINLVYKPLALRPIYKNKLTILCDKPDAAKLARFEEFKRKHAHLETNQQLHVLPVLSLEEYYPAQWRPTGSINSGAKKRLAEQVGKEISRQVFETEMKVMFDALSQCWGSAY